MTKFKILIALVCFFTLAASQRVVQTNNSYMLIPPADKNGTEIVILGLNGAFCDPDLYGSLYQTIQNYSSTYKIWIAMPIFPGNFPSNLDTRFPQTLAELREQGANTSNVFIAGHSLGGFIAQDYLSEANVTGYKGLIFFAKFVKFQYKDPQTNFPVPVLTIGGELDGLSKISRLAMSFNQMLSHPKGVNRFHFPVVIIPGAYHSSYVTGPVPEVIANSDIHNESTSEEVWAACAKFIDAFIDVHMNMDTVNTTYGSKILHDYIYGYTYDLMMPLIQAFAWEGNPYLYNASVINTTQWVADHIFEQIDLTASQIQTALTVLEVRNMSEFFNDEATALYSNGTLDYNVYTNKDIGVVESDDITSPPNQSAIWISTKYKSPSFISAISSLQLGAMANSSTCKMLNQKIIDDVMAIIPNVTMKRFMKWGVRLDAGDDIEYADNDSWNSSEALYEDHGGYIMFRSSRLETPVTSEFLGSHEGGDFYCKLISPGKVAEWIYVDGLRKYDGAGTDNSTNGTSSSASIPAGGLPGGFGPGGPTAADAAESKSHFGSN